MNLPSGPRLMVVKNPVARVRSAADSPFSHASTSSFVAPAG
jgi:hypothetical protein